MHLRITLYIFSGEGVYTHTRGMYIIYSFQRDLDDKYNEIARGSKVLCVFLADCAQQVTGVRVWAKSNRSLKNFEER